MQFLCFSFVALFESGAAKLRDMGIIQVLPVLLSRFWGQLTVREILSCIKSYVVCSGIPEHSFNSSTSSDTGRGCCRPKIVNFQKPKPSRSLCFRAVDLLSGHSVLRKVYIKQAGVAEENYNIGQRHLSVVHLDLMNWNIYIKASKIGGIQTVVHTYMLYHNCPVVFEAIVSRGKG